MIKSKKANQFLIDNVINSIDLGPDSYCYMLMEDVEQVVEIVEEELYSEEQCIEAFNVILSEISTNIKRNLSKLGIDYQKMFLSTLKSLKQ